MIIGYVIGDASPQQATILAEKPIRLGLYTIIEYDGEKVLGMITDVTRGSPMIDGNTIDIKLIERLNKIDSTIPHYIKGVVKLLYDLNTDSQPDLPPIAGSPVRLAEEEELNKIFSEGDLSLGRLIGANVPVKVKVSALSRHLAILAATGSGKSNTVAVLSQRIANLKGSVLIFDYHGEYSRSDLNPLNVIEPRLNPLYLTAREFATLLEIKGNAPIQYRILRRAFVQYQNEIKKKIQDGQIDYEELNDNFVSDLESIIDSEQEKGNKKDSLDEVKNKLEEFADKYSGIIDLTSKDIISNLKTHNVNVVDISPLDEDTMDAIVSHYLRRILDARKEYKRKGNGLKFPVITVIEEAHVFLSKTDDTLTKFWASRIAREGRKFGVGLIIVSQRPKGLDENILSQMTNKIILRIVEPSDKKYVLEASDNLSEDLVNQLSSLGVGEALVIGNLVKIPAVLKIDKFAGLLGGSDPNMIEEWEKADEEYSINKGFADFG
ncbi:DNA double-strand break repair helicase HerA [Acidianus manzaensis]|uniref:Uncharacterized protein n=1 Tax=Acidianus manzaensis TaxID=282676 RepID=A0A1W6JXP4_9CREN|nr:DNA double-strand break repair helicase HerA [Acidianus manzaensis]ARM75000.1 hypothetical protein B6F84_02460 [Acidianus manzaensis]